MKKFLLLTWLENIVHFDKVEKKMKSLPYLSDDENIFPLIVDEDGFILSRNSFFNDVKLNIVGNYVSLVDENKGLYYSSRRNGAIYAMKDRWEKWEQFFLKPLDCYDKSSEVAIENLNIKKISIINHEERVNNSIPRIIWMFWDGDETPLIVKACFEKIKSLNYNYKINICNFSNINDYVDIKFNEHVDLKIAHKADIIRLALLEKYGGVWIDASVLMSLPMDRLISSINNCHVYDVIAFYIEKGNDYENPVLENWFLAAPQGSSFVAEWLKILLPLKDLGDKKYLEKLKMREDFLRITRKISNPGYLLPYVAHQIVLQESNNKFNFFLWNANFSAFSLQYQFNWDAEVIVKLLSTVDKNFFSFPHTPIIKFPNSFRRSLDGLLRKDQVRENSFIYKFINDESLIK
jgi:hypothetical protein